MVSTASKASATAGTKASAPAARIQREIMELFSSFYLWSEAILCPVPEACLPAPELPLEANGLSRPGDSGIACQTTNSLIFQAVQLWHARCSSCRPYAPG